MIMDYVTICVTDKNEVAEGLRQLVNFDEDFNGNNGMDFVWQSAKDKGYTSNLEFLLDTYILENDDYHNDMFNYIERFMDDWRKTWWNVCNDFGFRVDGNGKFATIVFAIC